MTTKAELVRGKIAKILNSREVALNIGKNQGVAPGMRFEILPPAGFDIPDPDTGAMLGSVAIPKVTVKITRVYDQVSVASTYRTKRVDISKRALFQRPQWERRYETLKAGGGFEKEPVDLDEANSYVATGDPVVQVRDDGD